MESHQWTEWALITEPQGAGVSGVLREARVSSAHGTVEGAGRQRNARVRPWKSEPNSLAPRCLPASTVGSDAGGAGPRLFLLRGIHPLSYKNQ